MSGSVTIQKGETLEIVPHGKGVRLIIKGRLTIIRDLSCETMAAIMFLGEQAMDEADCAKQRREARDAADALQARQTALLNSLAPDVPY